MQFVKDNDLYKVARLTGPTHNLLAVRLSVAKCRTEVTALPVRPGDLKRLDGQKILSQVLAGLDSVNTELGKEYFLSEVQYVPSDTESPFVYKFLIRALVTRIDAGGKFVVI